MGRVPRRVVAALWPPRPGANCMRKHDTASQHNTRARAAARHGETRRDCVWPFWLLWGDRLTEQSEPAVSGHGRQAPELQLPGAVQPPRSSPILHPQLKSCWEQASACQC